MIEEHQLSLFDKIFLEPHSEHFKASRKLVCSLKTLQLCVNNGLEVEKIHHSRRPNRFCDSVHSTPQKDKIQNRILRRNFISLPITPFTERLLKVSEISQMLR